MNATKPYLSSCLSILLIAGALTGGETSNLIQNGDLNAGANEKPNNWTFSTRHVDGQGEWIDDNSRDGNKVLKVAVKNLGRSTDENYGSAAWSSMRFSIDPAKPLDFSLWVKGQNIVGGKGFFKLRATCHFFDLDGKHVSFKDLVCADGNFDWRRETGCILVPEKARYASVSCGLTSATGIAYFSDIKLSIKENSMTKMEFESMHGPIVIPKPWKATYGEIFAPPSTTASLKLDSDEAPIISKELESALVKAGFKLGNDANALTVKAVQSPLSIAEPKLKARLLESWSALPEDGYLLEVSDKPEPVVYLIARNPAARLYAVQTLKCMLVNGGRLWTGSVADYPEVALRGMPMGMHWWKQQDKAIDRLTSLKCNYIYTVNWRPGVPWRKPLDNGELSELKSYLMKCHEHFIEPCMIMCPRGNAKIGSPTTNYSSPAEVQLVVEKFKALYDLGFRNFALDFDDLGNGNQDVLISEDDKKNYKDIGEAHYSFISRIYDEISKMKGTSLRVIPLWYGPFASNSDKKLDYLANLSKLPPEIDIVYCERSLSGIHASGNFLKRKNPPIIWDNFLAKWGDAGISMSFLPPIAPHDGFNGYNKNSIAGYICIPPIPKCEDIGLSSWNTMADAMWAPSRYNPDEALARAVVKALGKDWARDFRDYTKFLEDATSFVPDMKDKESRIASIKGMDEKLTKWQERLKDAPIKELRASVECEIGKRHEDLAKMLSELKDKNFPAVVPAISIKPMMDGDIENDPAWRDISASSGFAIANATKLATQQTSFKMCHDGENFYLAITCMETSPGGLVAKIKKHDDNVYTDDCIDLFLDNTQSRACYYHIIVNSTGTIFDANRVRIGGVVSEEDKEWNANISVATKKFADRWTVEMALPLKDFGGAPGVRWNFNVCRERQIAPKEFSSYVLLKNGFHDPARFWTLELGK